MHKVGMLVVLCGRVVGLKSLEELTENLLRDFTPSSFQIGESRQTEGRIEIMRHRVERPAQRQSIRIPLKLELCHGQGVLCHRGALQLRHLAVQLPFTGVRMKQSRFLRLCRQRVRRKPTLRPSRVNTPERIAEDPLCTFLAHTRARATSRHRCALAFVKVTSTERRRRTATGPPARELAANENYTVPHRRRLTGTVRVDKMEAVTPARRYRGREREPPRCHRHGVDRARRLANFELAHARRPHRFAGA